MHPNVTFVWLTALLHRKSHCSNMISQIDPGAKIGIDLCELHNCVLLIICYYYSNFIKVERITHTTTGGVTKVLKAQFARYNVPDTAVSDNGPQFSTKEFATFSKSWGFTHVTSLPRYPQSNGKAENAVKTLKRLLTKCHESGQSEHLALLDWHNAASEGLGTSPAQRFLGRRCKTLLPTARSCLQPSFPTVTDMQARTQQRQRQQVYYNKHAKH